ncbi:MAG: DMT family transporter, partial [Chloroflexota bacterium]|nr:DMT family transporter [Chloroflexota bacterium]
MTAVLGGAGAAICFAVTTLCSSRSARMLGPPAALGWVMLVGLVITAPLVAASGLPSALDGAMLPWLAISGAGNVLGLLLEYAGLRTGKVGVVAALASAEGAVAALLSVLVGERLETAVAVPVAVVGLGVVLAGLTPDDPGAAPPPRALRPTRAALFGVAAALAFGASLYA